MKRNPLRQLATEMANEKVKDQKDNMAHANEDFLNEAAEHTRKELSAKAKERAALNVAKMPRKKIVRVGD